MGQHSWSQYGEHVHKEKNLAPLFRGAFLAYFIVMKDKAKQLLLNQSCDTCVYHNNPLNIMVSDIKCYRRKEYRDQLPKEKICKNFRDLHIHLPKVHASLRLGRLVTESDIQTMIDIIEGDS